MKEIYLRVKVPDGSPEINKAMVGSDDGYFHISNDVTEIQFPSEEEIESKAKSVTRNEFGLKGFKMGATWLLNKMKGE